VGISPFGDNLGQLFINPCRTIEGILVRVSGWARLSNTTAFLRQNEIQIGIEECYREVSMSTDRFMVRPALHGAKVAHLIFFLQVALSMVKASESQEQEKARQRDHGQIFDMIAQILGAVRKMPQPIPLEASQSLEQLLPVSL